MGKQWQLLLGLCLFLLSAVSASAAVTVSRNELVLQVDYALFNQDNQQTISVPTESFTLTNAGAEEVTLSYTLIGLPTAYKSETKTITLPAGATSGALTLNVDVPHREDSGTRRIGTLSITAPNGTPIVSTPTPVSLKQETKPLLEFDKIEFEYFDEDGEKRTKQFSGTDEKFTISDNFLIGTQLKMTFKLQNRFDKHYDQDSSEIKDVTITLDPSESELFSEDLSKAYGVGTLSARESREKEITLTINSDATVAEYTVDIEVDGEDGEGAEHILKRELDFEITRKRDDVRLTKAEVIPATLSCEKQVTVAVNLKNFGSRSQDFGGVLIFNEALGIRKNVKDLTLKSYDQEGNTWNGQYTFIVPADARKGTQYIDFTAFIKNDVKTDTKRIPLVVGECVEETSAAVARSTPSESGNGSGNNGNTNSNQPEVVPSVADKTQGQQQVTSSQVVKKTVERKPLSSRQLWIGGLVAVVLLVVAIDALLIALLMKKR